MIRNTLPQPVTGFVPWIEMNNGKALVEKLWETPPYGTEHGMMFQEYTSKAIKTWAAVTDRVLVTTNADQVPGLFDYLRSESPITIAGGVKTSSLLSTATFCDPPGWDAVAKCAEAIVKATGVNECTLSNEGALKTFHAGQETINVARLAQGMSSLRLTGIPFVWYLPEPLIASSAFPNRTNATCDLMCRIAEWVPNSKFMCSRLAKPWDLEDADHIACHLRMVHTLGLDRIVYRYFVAPVSEAGDRGYYTPKNAITAMQATPRSQRSLWSGAYTFLKVAEEILIC